MGAKQVINSENTINGNSQAELKRKLLDANTVAKGIKEIPLKSKTNKNHGRN